MNKNEYGEVINGENNITTKKITELINGIIENL